MEDDRKHKDYKDEFRDRLHEVIEKRMKQKGLVSHVDRDADGQNETAATNVVDFMSLLQTSLSTNKRTPAAKSAHKAAGKSPAPAAKKVAAKKSVAKAAKTSAKKTATRRKSA